MKKIGWNLERHSYLQTNLVHIVTILRQKSATLQSIRPWGDQELIFNKYDLIQRRGQSISQLVVERLVRIQKVYYQPIAMCENANSMGGTNVLIFLYQSTTIPITIRTASRTHRSPDWLQPSTFFLPVGPPNPRIACKTAGTNRRVNPQTCLHK